MSKFDLNASSKRSNLAGGKAHIDDDRQTLALMVIGSTMSNDFFYDTDQQRIATMTTLVGRLLARGDAAYVAKTMVYARRSADLRSVSHVLGVLLCEYNTGKGHVRKAIYHGVKRVDDMTEMVALWNTRHPGHMVPNGMRRAFRDILDEGRFDAYQLRKYEKVRGRVKLRDIIKIARPSKQLELYKLVLDSSLPKIALVHDHNDTQAELVDAFVAKAKERRVGYMEALKLTPRLFQGELDRESFESWSAIIGSEGLIRKSQVLPFRYYQAYRRLKQTVRQPGKRVFDVEEDSRPMSTLTEHLDALVTGDRPKPAPSEVEVPVHSGKLIFERLEAASRLAVRTNALAQKGETVALLVDDSYSMSSGSLGITLFEHALIMVKSIADTVGFENIRLYFWSDRCIEKPLRTRLGLWWVEQQKMQGGLTYADKPFERLIADMVVVDKAVVLTDCQIYEDNAYQGKGLQTYIDIYRETVSSQVKVLVWDLAGYGVGSPVKVSDDVMQIGGLSDKLLALVPKLWGDKDALVKAIEKVEL